MLLRCHPVQVTSIERFLRFHIQCCESFRLTKLPACSAAAGVPILTQTIILDMGGLSPMKHFTLTVRNFLHALSQIDQVWQTGWMEGAEATPGGRSGTKGGGEAELASWPSCRLQLVNAHSAHSVWAKRSLPTCQLGGSHSSLVPCPLPCRTTSLSTWAACS